MQSTVHELPHGSNSPQKLSTTAIIGIATILIFIGSYTPPYVPMIISLALFLYFGGAKNERRTEEPTLKIEYDPRYMLTKVDAIAMIRNMETEKRGR